MFNQEQIYGTYLLSQILLPQIFSSVIRCSDQHYFYPAANPLKLLGSSVANSRGSDDY